jgi:hypothetical protein
MSENKVGAPTKYKPEYCEMLVTHMAKGLSYESFGATLTPRISRSALYLWEKEHDEFMNAKKTGADASLLFWEQHGIDGLYSTKEEKYNEKTGRIESSISKSLNSAVWIVNMKNRHKWTDRVEIKDESPRVIKLQYSLDEDDKKPGDVNEPDKKSG